MRTPTMGQGIRDAQIIDVGTEQYHRLICDRQDVAPCDGAIGGTPYVSCSMIKSFMDDPQSCWEEYVARIVTREPNKGMIFGTALERLCFFEESPNAVTIPQEVLQERRKANSEEVTYAKSGAPWNEWKERMIAEHGPDVRLLKVEEFSKEITPLFMARDALQAHEAAAKLIWGDAEPHVTVTGVDESTGIALPVKMQLDLKHSRNLLVDLKSCAPSILDSAASLMNRVRDYGYHLQAWSYVSLWYALTGEVLPFIFVFVSSESPFRVRVFELDDSWMELAEIQWRDGLSRLSKCWQSGVWQLEDYGRIIKLPMPRYAMTAWEDEIKARVSK